MRQIELPIGCNLKEAVEILIEHNINGESVYAVFNNSIGNVSEKQLRKCIENQG